MYQKLSLYATPSLYLVLRCSNLMCFDLVAAGAYPELTDWCEFVGEWITELAFRSLQLDEMKGLHSDVEQLCLIVPELWHTSGRAHAALEAAVGA
jgi:hypothetical protein